MLKKVCSGRDEILIENCLQDAACVFIYFYGRKRRYVNEDTRENYNERTKKGGRMRSRHYRRRLYITRSLSARLDVSTPAFLELFNLSYFTALLSLIRFRNGKLDISLRRVL